MPLSRVAAQARGRRRLSGPRHRPDRLNRCRTPRRRSMSEVPTDELRLAPMAGVTNAPFRLVARECGAGLLTSEEIDARALLANNAHTRELAQHLPEEHPLAMQLLGAEPDVLAEAARRLEAAGADA